MKSLLSMLFLQIGVAGMVSCEKPTPPTTPPMIDSGISFGPYRLGGGSILDSEIRLKFVSDQDPQKSGALKYIVKLSSSPKDSKDFEIIAKELGKKKNYPFTGSQYLNTLIFTLEDEDGFPISEIKISDPINQPQIFRSKSELEYKGEIPLKKEEALKIEGCTARSTLESSLRKLLNSPG